MPRLLVNKTWNEVIRIITLIPGLVHQTPGGRPSCPQGEVEEAAGEEDLTTPLAKIDFVSQLLAIAHLWPMANSLLKDNLFRIHLGEEGCFAFAKESQDNENSLVYICCRIDCMVKKIVTCHSWVTFALWRILQSK